LEIKKLDYLFLKIKDMRSVDTIKKATEKIAENVVNISVQRY
jgi:hypothetical protein